MLVYKTLNNKQEAKLLGEDILDLCGTSFSIPESFNYQVINITDEYIARPDLISQHMYGNSAYADIICKLNGVNPFEINTGMYLIAPDLTDIRKFMVVPSVSSDDFIPGNNITSEGGVDVEVTKQKSKKEVRKPNEQVIGDRNFRIDKNNKVVVY